MSKIQPKRAHAKEIIEKFLGLRADGKEQASAIENFTNLRLAPDGSVEKRNGWQLIGDIPEKVRGACSFDMYNDTICLAITSSHIYLCMEELGVVPFPTTLTDSDTPVQFLFYKNDIYLLDQQEIRVLDETDFVPAVGYVPLYGLGWDTYKMGEPYEQPNLLMPKLRVNYYNPEHNTVVYLPFYAEKIDALVVDGKKVTDFSFGPGRNILMLSTTGTEIDVAFTYYLDDNGRTIQGSRIAAVDEIANEEVMILGGADVDRPQLFLGWDIDPARHAGSQLYYPTSRPLYFRSENTFQFGSSVWPLRTVYKSGSNSLLIFTGDKTYSLSLFSEPDNGMAVSLVNNHLGCQTYNMNVFLEGDPLILNASGLFRVRGNGQSDLTFTPIPCPYPELTAQGFATNATICHNIAQNEIWIRDRRDTEGTVLVYNTLRKVWYRFRGIHAEFLFPFAGKVGIATQNQIGQFHVGIYEDNDQPIEAEYCTDFMDFGEPEIPKRALRLSITTESDATPFEVSLESESRTKVLQLTGKGRSAPEHFDIRAAIGRFRHLRVRVRHAAPGRFRIKRLALFANL